MTKQTKSDLHAINTGRTKRANKAPAEKALLGLTAEQKRWQGRLASAVKAHVQTGVRLLDLIREAVELEIPEQAVRESVREAYMAQGVSSETARKRGADAVTVYQGLSGARKAPKDLPNNLQQAASAVRKASAKPRGPKARNTDKPAPRVAATTSPLATIEAAIQAMRDETDDLGELSILAEMADLLADLAERKANMAEEIPA